MGYQVTVIERFYSPARSVYCSAPPRDAAVNQPRVTYSFLMQPQEITHMVYYTPPTIDQVVPTSVPALGSSMFTITGMLVNTHLLS